MSPQSEKTKSLNPSSTVNAIAVPHVDDFQIQVDGKLYSTEKLAGIHPGGELFVRAFGGQDATEAYLSYHRRKFPHERVASCLVGEASSRKHPEADADYLELCSEVEKVLPRNKSFAPFSYFVKIGVILTLAFGLEAYIHYTASYKWYLTAPLGLLMALIGLNIQHDANHGSISPYPWINRILGTSQNWIGGSALEWIHQHVVQHHVHTNDINHDPDITGNPLLRTNPLKPLFQRHALQHLYVFVALAFFGFAFVMGSIEDIWKGSHFTPMAKTVNSYRPFELFMFLVFIFRWFLLPLYQVPSLLTLLHGPVPLLIVGGYYLAFFFIISHNFKGVEMFDKTQFNQKESFLFNQVVSSSNVGGSFLGFLNGGLNYQIEHHLFPRIQHSHYPTIAPIVKKFCEKKRIPYLHFPTLGANVVACSQHLYSLGHEETPKELVH